MTIFRAILFFLRKYSGRIIALALIFALTLYTLHGLARFSEVLNPPAENANINSVLESEPFPTVLLNELQNEKGQWIFANSYWLIQPLQWTTQELQNAAQSWPSRDSTPDTNQQTLQDTELIETIKKLATGFAAFAPISKAFPKVPGMKATQNFKNAPLWKTSEQSPFCRYQMLSPSFLVDFVVFIPQHEKESKQEHLLSFFVAFRSEGDLWSVFQFHRPKNEIQESRDLLPIPPNTERLCARCDEQGVLKLDFLQTRLTKSELEHFWKNSGWTLETSPQETTLHWRCRQGKRVIDVMGFHNTENHDGTTKLLIVPVGPL